MRLYPSTMQRSPGMRKPMPHITESADAWQRRMQSEPDLKKRQRLHAFSLAASGQARYRQEIATLLGVHRHSVARVVSGLYPRWLRPGPALSAAPAPVHQRLTATALAALQAKLQDPHGFAGYRPMQGWLAEEHQVS